MQVELGSHLKSKSFGTSRLFHRVVPLLILQQFSLNIQGEMHSFYKAYSYFLLGHRSFRNTYLPSLLVPSACTLKSMSTVPARAKHTTSGGLARQLARVAGWTLPSKFLFPDRTEAATKSLSLIKVSSQGFIYPELPIQVMQPYPVIENPSSYMKGSRPAFWQQDCTTWLPGEREVLMQGLTRSPSQTAFLQIRPAASMTPGLEVLVHEVMAAMTTLP